MARSPLPPIAVGLAAVIALAIAGALATGPRLAHDLDARARTAIEQAGMAGHVTARFITPRGWPTRHPVLEAAPDLRNADRNRIAKAIAAIPGVAGVRWSDSGGLNDNAQTPINPRHCQDEVAVLLRARTIRFEESSAVIDHASETLIDQVAATLRPCLGSIIAITGHTDTSGPEPGNIALSRERAEAVRDALIARGIPSDGLRARGVGSRVPVRGLPPGDPANRRIEFSVIAVEPIVPTPVDTPGPR